MILNSVSKFVNVDRACNSIYESATNNIADPVEFIFSSIYEISLMEKQITLNLMCEEYSYLRDNGVELSVVQESNIIGTFFGGLFKLIGKMFQSICSFFKSIFSKNKENVNDVKKECEKIKTDSDKKIKEMEADSDKKIKEIEAERDKRSKEIEANINKIAGESEFDKTYKGYDKLKRPSYDNIQINNASITEFNYKKIISDSNTAFAKFDDVLFKYSKQIKSQYQLVQRVLNNDNYMSRTDDEQKLTKRIHDSLEDGPLSKMPNDIQLDFLDVAEKYGVRVNSDDINDRKNTDYISRKTIGRIDNKSNSVDKVLTPIMKQVQEDADSTSELLKSLFDKAKYNYTTMKNGLEELQSETEKLYKDGVTSSGNLAKSNARFVGATDGKPLTSNEQEQLFNSYFKYLSHAIQTLYSRASQTCTLLYAEPSKFVARSVNIVKSDISKIRQSYSDAFKKVSDDIAEFKKKYPDYDTYLAAQQLKKLTRDAYNM